MPLRVDGPDRISAAEKKTINRVINLNKKREQQRVKPKKDNAVVGFIKSASKVVGDLNLPEVGFGSTPRPGNQFGGNIRRQPVKPAKVKHAVEAAGELSGINPARRIRSGKGTTGDYIALGAIALPPTLRSGITAARQPMRMGIVSNPKISEAMTRGAFTLKNRPGSKPGLEELDDMLEGVERPGIKRYPMNPYKGDQGFHDRIPFLTQRNTGRVSIGDYKESHGGLARAVTGREYMVRGEYDNYAQGMINRIEENPMTVDLGFGVWSGSNLPKNVAHVHRLLQHLLRNYEDSDVLLRNATPHLTKAINRNGIERTALLMQQMGIKNTDQMERALRAFAREEKNRRR